MEFKLNPRLVTNFLMRSVSRRLVTLLSLSTLMTSMQIEDFE